MQLRNEPQVGLRINLARLAVVSASIVGVFALLVFFFSGMFSSGDSVAASVTVSNTTTVQSDNNPFGSLGSGDTIYLFGKFNINDDYTIHSNNQITLIANGSAAEIKVFKDKLLALGAGSSIVLLNGATLTYTGNCTSTTSIEFGGSEVANCSGANGAMSFSQVNAAGGINVGSLPVSWLSVDAEVITKTEVKLNWSTASEENNSHFDVEFSLDAENWKNAGTVYTLSDNGFSNEILTYSYTHYIYEVANMVYYRIKQTDHDGQFDYSDVITARFKTEMPIQIGTLGDNRLNISVGGKKDPEARINVFDLTGTMIKTTNLSDNTIIQLDKSGVYIIEVVNGYDVQRIKHYVS